MIQFTEFLIFTNFNSKACYSVHSFVPIDKWPLFEFYSCFLRGGKPYIPCQSLLLSTIVLNDIHIMYGWWCIVVANKIIKMHIHTLLYCT